MAILEVLRFPDKRLHNKACPVDRVDHAIRAVVDDMLETMYAETGIGLAATQVDIQKNIFVADFSENKDTPLCFINPKINSAEGEQFSEEGCLSLPGYYAKVRRAAKVTMNAVNRDGQAFVFKAEGMAAVCMQHEMDHLQGMLFIDHLSSIKRYRLFKAMKKMGISTEQLRERRRLWLSRIDHKSSTTLLEKEAHPWEV